MPPDSSTWNTLISALAGNPAQLMLALFLVGGGFVVYKLAMRWLDIFQSHGDRLTDEVKNVGESLKGMDAKMEKLSDKLEDLAERVTVHERRIEKMEDR